MLLQSAISKCNLMKELELIEKRPRSRTLGLQVFGKKHQKLASEMSAGNATLEK